MLIQDFLLHLHMETSPKYKFSERWRDKALNTSHEIHNKGRLAVKGTEASIWAKPHPEDPNVYEGAICC